MTWHDPWKEFRDASGLDSVANAFEDSGLEFLSYSNRVMQGREIEVLRVSDGLRRYGVFGIKGKPLGVARFTISGLSPIRVLQPLPGEDRWSAIVRSIWLSVKFD